MTELLRRKQHKRLRSPATIDLGDCHGERNVDRVHYWLCQSESHREWCRLALLARRRSRLRSRQTVARICRDRLWMEGGWPASVPLRIFGLESRYVRLR